MRRGTDPGDAGRNARTRPARHRWLGFSAIVGLVGLPALSGGGTSAGAAAPTVVEAAGDRGTLQPAEVTATESVPRGPQLKVFGTGDAPETYLIRLADAAVPSYTGDQPGLAPTAPEPGERLDPAAEPVAAYRAHLEAEQVEFVQRMERTTGRPVEVPFTYQYAVNGLAAVLTADEARAVAEDPAVVSITPDKVRELHTDAGPQWLGAEALWNAMAELGLPEDYKGEGIVIGTIDTGISPGNRSFAATGDDGYTVTNPLGEGNYLGACDPANEAQYDPEFQCNSKLIGAYVFGGLNESAVDYDGHGSHTASTSGGNVVNGVVVESPTLDTPPFDISGVAPHANVISYLGCCNLSGLTASINQAIADGVDVINYSIGSPDPSAAWDDFDTVGFLNARAAGIFVATSNGNDGPGDATTGSPSDAPWIISVGASTHPRHNGNALTGLTSSEGTLPDLAGKSVTGALTTPTPIVDAAAFDDPFCETTTGNEEHFGGKIVVCERGVNGRVEKSENVAGQGAAGFVLTNDEIHGDSLLGDEYAVPGVFISYADAQTLKAWLATGTDHVGTIAGTTFTVDEQYADIMASFSSRGPNRAVDTITPSVTAPGVDILAALGDDTYTSDIHGFISGTSMSSPHVAGAGALLTQARPDWTPAEQQSALMTTARPTVLNHDGTPATPYAQGSGHIDVGAAVRAGLLFDETIANYLDANPAEGGDPKTLNLPSFANSQCLASCSWERTATVPADAEVPAGVTWTASAVSDAGLTLDVQLSPATVSPGDAMAISVTADVTEAEVGETYFGRITLTPSDPSVPAVTMPVAVVPSAGVLPAEIDVTTRRNAGSSPVTGIESLAVSEFTGSVRGLVRADQHEGTLGLDPTNGDPYDDLSQVDVITVEVPEGSDRFVVDTLASSMADMDLYVGTGDTPSAATEVCSSASPGSIESCEIPAPEAGTWWVLVQNWEEGSTPPDTYTLATAVVPSTSAGNAGVDGPDGAVPVGEPYDVRLFWDLPEMAEGDVWYGTAVLGTSPESPGDIGTVPVTVRRVADDVTKTASVDEATVGEPISYEITVQPNVTPEDLTYTIVDTVPDGLTIDPESVTGGGVVDGQTITWTVPMPTAAGKTGEYVVSTPADNPQCANWSGFLDLAPLGIPLVDILDGDSIAANAFSNIGPFEQYGGRFTGLVVADDGMVTVTGGYGGQPHLPQAIPDPAAPNGVIAPLWADLELSVADGRGVRLASNSDLGAAVIQWDDPFEFGGDPTDLSNSVGRFQTWIYSTVSDQRPEITFEYGEVGALPALATIGIESILGDRATAVVAAADPTAAVESGSLCLDYQGFVLEPAILSYTVTVDADASTGTATNAAVHVTDDPYAQPVTASVDVAITGAEEPEPEPCSIVIGGFRAGGVTVRDGIACIEGATVLGQVSVKQGAGVRISGSTVLGTVKATQAAEVTVCGSSVVGTLSSTGAAAVTIGDPANDCAGNLVVGTVKVDQTSGPSVISGNVIVGKLACAGNDPAPTDHGTPNTVLGQRSGQCGTPPAPKPPKPPAGKPPTGTPVKYSNHGHRHRPC